MFKRYFRKQKAKSELIKAFRAAGVYREIKRDKKMVKVYPTIPSVRFLEDRTEYVFVLPAGIKPADVSKNIVIFKQVFGKNIELTSDDVKKFVLNINKTSMPKELKYEYETISNLVEGMRIPIVCGVDKNGQYIVFDAIENGEVNFLIAGEPGSGKSTMIRQILTTLICTKSPDELQLYLADLKLSEFHIFSKIKHLQADIAESPNELHKITQKLMKEVNKRGKLLKENGVAHVDDLPIKIPYIALFIDEIVMLIGEKDVLKDLVQLVALGRALGILTFFSLQRPSHDILDTKIRGLLAVRMGFRTTDFSNSKIVGTIGSEKISAENRGRYILKRSELMELQSPYLTQKEAEKLLKPHFRPKDKQQIVEEVVDDEPMFKLGVLDDAEQEG